MADPIVVPINADVPASWEPPGVYFQLNTKGGGSALDDAFKRVLIWGYKAAAGTAPVSSPIRCPSRSDALTLAGAGSDLCRLYQAYSSQAGDGVADVYLMPIPEPSSGTQATHLIVVAGAPTTAGSVSIWICGYACSVRIATTDTATTIGANIAAAINLIANLPCTAAAVAGTVTLTYTHKGLVGNDLPIIVNQTGATGVAFSPGTITYANAAVGAGSATVTIGGTTITATLAGGESATQVGTKVAAAINGGAYPCTASDGGNGTVTLLYATDRVVNKISAAIVTSTGTTATVACGTVIVDGSTQRPTITTALSALANFAGGARLWLSPFADATTIGAMENHIETMQNGQYQRDQYLIVGSNDGITTAGAIPTTVSPVLTNLYRYTIACCPDSPQQGYEEAARCVGIIAAESYVAKNYDGAELHTDSAQVFPNMLPHPAVRLGPQSDDAQSALHTYGLTPIAVTADGRKVVVKGRTTDLRDPTNGGIPDWGIAQLLGYMRVQFVDAGSAAVSGKSIRRNGTPRTANTINLIQIKSALVARARDLDNLDLYDGIDVWSGAFALSFNAQDPTRVDGYVPLAVIRPLHIAGFVGTPQ